MYGAVATAKAAFGIIVRRTNIAEAEHHKKTGDGFLHRPRVIGFVKMASEF